MDRMTKLLLTLIAVALWGLLLNQMGFWGSTKPPVLADQSSQQGGVVAPAATVTNAGISPLPGQLFTVVTTDRKVYVFSYTGGGSIDLRASKSF